MKRHQNPRCLKWGEGRAPQQARIRRDENAVKRVGERSELSTITNGCTLFSQPLMQKGVLSVVVSITGTLKNICEICYLVFRDVSPLTKGEGSLFLCRTLILRRKYGIIRKELLY